MRVVQGPALDEGSYGLGDIPIFTRAALLPLATLASQSGDVADPLQWLVFWRLCVGVGGGANPPASSYSLLEDDSSSNAYRAGAVASTTASASCASNSLTLTVAPTVGAFAGMPAARAFAMQVRGGPSAAPSAVTVNGAAVPPGRGAIGWYVEDDAANPLTQPAGALVVNAGPGFAANASTTIVVSW